LTWALNSFLSPCYAFLSWEYRLTVPLYRFNLRPPLLLWFYPGSVLCVSGFFGPSSFVVSSPVLNFEIPNPHSYRMLPYLVANFYCHGFPLAHRRIVKVDPSASSSPHTGSTPPMRGTGSCAFLDWLRLSSFSVSDQEDVAIGLCLLPPHVPFQ